MGKSVKILRDTGSVQSLICEKVLPPAAGYTGANILVRGIGSGCLNLPLHDLYLRSGLITGPVTLAVCAQLPVDGVDLILGNDLAGEDVFPRPLVSSNPNPNDFSLPVQNFRAALPACAVTCAQRKKFSDVIDLSESFFN